MTVSSITDIRNEITVELELDLDACVALAADRRRPVRRSSWYRDAACLSGYGFVDNNGPSAADLCLCNGCPVRTECAVEGLRTRPGGYVGDEAEIWGFFGGLSPREQGRLRQAIEVRAQQLDISIATQDTCRTDAVEDLHAEGMTCEDIAGELDCDPVVVALHLICLLGARGESHRQIALLMGGFRSYKWVERQARSLRAFGVAGRPVEAAA